jgi:hypothetical protein
MSLDLEAREIVNDGGNTIKILNGILKELGEKWINLDLLCANRLIL